MSVILYRDKVDSISIETFRAFTEEDKRAYAYLKKEKKQEFIWDLQKSLLEINVEFFFVPDLDKLERIHLTKKIYFDALIKDKFVDTILALRRAGSLIELSMYQHLRHYSNSNGNLMI
jgi:hypothetical protein